MAGIDQDAEKTERLLIVGVEVSGTLLNELPYDPGYKRKGEEISTTKRHLHFHVPHSTALQWPRKWKQAVSIN